MSSSPKPDLRLDWCSHVAAKYAVEHWHYSHSLPTPPIVRVGVWENEAFIGCVLFSRGANQNLGNAYGLKQTEVCELTRVALTSHLTPVSRIVSVAIRFVAKCSPGVRLVISFADPLQNHVGGIYQAGNWIYSGCTSPDRYYIDTNGRKWHSRQCSVTGFKPQYGTLRKVPKISECKKVETPGKHRYLYPLDAAMRAQIAPLAKPYPKRGAGETDNAARSNGQTGGASPTAPLLEGKHG